MQKKYYANKGQFGSIKYLFHYMQYNICQQLI